MTSQRDTIVSVIIPARNEESCLGSCLESLASQSGVLFEVIVVDDASADRTPEIAQAFAERIGGDLCAFTVISAPPLPENWTGKNGAMAAGARIAKGKWLLFTDADTVHKPGSLARALAEAEQHGVALLSYSPEQEVHTFWEKAVLPVVFSELATAYPPRKVSDSESSLAAANGQYLLISRAACDAVGGYATIAGNLLEDVAMARLVKSSGQKIRFRYGGDAVRTRMYRNWAQMKEGWTKNLALLFPHTGSAALAVALRWASAVAGILSVPLAISHVETASLPSAIALLALVFPLAVLMRIRRAHFSWDATLLGLLFGQPICVYLLLRSRSRMKRGGVTWKGREYLGRGLNDESRRQEALRARN